MFGSVSSGSLEGASVGEAEAAKVADRLQDEADETLGRAVRLIGGERARPRIVHGFVAAALVREVETA